MTKVKNSNKTLQPSYVQNNEREKKQQTRTDELQTSDLEHTR